MHRVPGYNTTVIGDYTRRFLGDAHTADDAQPWFLTIHFKAAHPPMVVESKYAGPIAADPGIPDEHDRADEPAYVRNQNITVAAARPERIAAWRALGSVDDPIVQTLHWLKTDIEWQHTLIMVTPDNGSPFGATTATPRSCPTPRRFACRSGRTALG